METIEGQMAGVQQRSCHIFYENLEPVAVIRESHVSVTASEDGENFLSFFYDV